MITMVTENDNIKAIATKDILLLEILADIAADLKSPEISEKIARMNKIICGESND